VRVVTIVGQRYCGVVPAAPVTGLISSDQQDRSPDRLLARAGTERGENAIIAVLLTPRDVAAKMLTSMLSTRRRRPPG